MSIDQGKISQTSLGQKLLQQVEELQCNDNILGRVDCTVCRAEPALAEHLVDEVFSKLPIRISCCFFSSAQSQ